MVPLAATQDRSISLRRQNDMEGWESHNITAVHEEAKYLFVREQERDEFDVANGKARYFRWQGGVHGSHVVYIDSTCILHGGNE